MVLPYAMWTQVRLRCPHCKREEVLSRALVFVGSERTCPSCRQRYVVRESFPLLSPRGRSR